MEERSKAPPSQPEDGAPKIVYGIRCRPPAPVLPEVTHDPFRHDLLFLGLSIFVLQNGP
jgi:hypothetical protein